MAKVMVVAVHPDDETLGCGGTLLRHKNDNDEIFWLIITDLHEHKGFSLEKVTKRTAEINDVASTYGFSEVFNLSLPTMRLEEEPKSVLIELISKVFAKVKPEIVYLPFYGDAHSEHNFVFECAYACTKVFRYPFVKEIYLMETLSETDFAPALSYKTFTPNYFVDISPFLDDKIAIMMKYASEIDQHPFPRSVDSLRAQAVLRGSQAGVKYAESFMMLKKIR